MKVGNKYNVCTSEIVWPEKEATTKNYAINIQKQF